MWLLLAACRHDEPDPAPALDWGDPVTTLTRRLIPDPPLPSPAAVDPAYPDGLAAALADGLGGASEDDGEPHLVREELAARGAQPHRSSIALVLHESDAQIADTESPTRLVALDTPFATESAARPQELYAVHALDALIRTADALSVDHPIDFAVITGDNADSAQGNETDWFISVWDGRELRADSGSPDAQPDADGNDPIAPFTPVGARFPWYTVAGNHDTLVQGNFAPEGALAVDALGQAAAGGTRDLSQPGGPVTFTSESADPERALLDRSSLVERYLASSSEPTGHGFTAQNATDGTATWSASPVPGVRLLGLDTNPPDASNGILSIAERDGFLIPALNAARDQGELVIVTSHYPLGPLAIEGGGTLGDLLVQYPNVVLSLVGHTHRNHVVAYGEGGHGFWEIETCATADWPSEARLVELVDNGDGTLSIYGTMVDSLAPAGTLSAEARRRTLVDWQSGWRSDEGIGAPTDRNVELLVPVPPGVAPNGSRARVDSPVLP